MAWNEPGGGKDPWGGNRGDQGPPDIDEALKKLKEKLTMFGGKGGGIGKPGGSIKGLLPAALLGFYSCSLVVFTTSRDNELSNTL